jgi:hypothetical protein
MKTGVLVHGCNLNIENWRHVAWGDPPDQPGRIPQGLLVAMQWQADVIVFGTGASAKEFRLGESPQPGRKLVESEYGLEYLRQHFGHLRQFRAIRSALDEAQSDTSWAAAQHQWLPKIQLDTRSRNTLQEIREAFAIFRDREIQRVVLVSSPSHIIRCLRDATALLSEDEGQVPFRHALYACPSVTCYEGTTPADVVVVEPPHRPDRHVVPTHRRIQRMLTLQRLHHDDLVRLIEEFDDLLQRYEHRYYNEGG